MVMPEFVYSSLLIRLKMLHRHASRLILYENSPYQTKSLTQEDEYRRISKSSINNGFL